MLCFQSNSLLIKAWQSSYVLYITYAKPIYDVQAIIASQKFKKQINIVFNKIRRDYTLPMPILLISKNQV
ncbi:hypothetical protein VNO77_18034 [Canavalia gladiata]|uniref:Uncharacterized protein n=1 Tax=Canavalia gladiata TaxID=3824 RepID=A0AAN9QN99_CANGL